MSVYTLFVLDRNAGNHIIVCRQIIIIIIIIIIYKKKCDLKK